MELMVQMKLMQSVPPGELEVEASAALALLVFAGAEDSVR